jgi:hypothetical protein
MMQLAMNAAIWLAEMMTNSLEILALDVRFVNQDGDHIHGEN